MNAQHDDYDEVRQALREALPPMDTELRRDLWPLMRRRLDAPKLPVAWYDWALAAAAGGVMVVFPELLLMLVYHL
jgi:hypothetical protein